MDPQKTKLIDPKRVDVGNLKTKQKQKVDFEINFIIKILKNCENHHIPKLTKNK